MLQSHKGSAETLSGSDTGYRGLCFNPTRVLLKHDFANWPRFDDETGLQSHKGSAETMAHTVAAQVLDVLQSHKGSAETTYRTTKIARVRSASIPQGFC